MRVIVYVEGPSDKAAMNALLEPLLEQKRQEGISIEFFETPAGDRKAERCAQCFGPFVAFLTGLQRRSR